MTVIKVDAPWLRAALLDEDEIALVDTREEGLYGASHILRAVNIPLSHFEIDLRRLIPNKGVRFVLMDDDADRLDKAVAIAEAAGYTNLFILPGGSEAWGESGFELFSGLNVPSKVFGEFVEHTYDTPRIEAADLKKLMDEGQDLIVLDSRPMPEYNAMNIPGGIDAPGAELVYRAKDAIPSDDTLVIVNCAGRTRSIIGCQSLVNAGLPNKVMALKDGTMGWHLAGLKLEKGSTRTIPAPSAETIAWAREAAERVSSRFGVQTVDRATADSWLAEPSRTTYLIDVRSPEEYAAGHLPGAAHAPGGQLVQATDSYIGVQKARIVLVDDVEVRARMTASWLIQMGWRQVYVLENGLGDGPFESGADIAVVPEADSVSVQTVTVDGLQALDDVLILDLSTSVQHRKGHIPGSKWAIRSTLARDIDLPAAGTSPIVISSRNDVLSRLAAGDLIALGCQDVRVLEGGHDAWVEAGNGVETGLENTIAPLPAEDLYFRPYDRDHGIEQAMKAYLDWEVALVEQLERDQTMIFPQFPAA